GHALKRGPEAIEEAVEGRDHVEDAVVTAGVSPVVGFIERNVEHPGFGGFEILEGHFKGEGIVARLVPRGERDLLKTAQIRRRGRVLVAGVDVYGSGTALGDVMEMIPTGEEGDAG